MQSILGATPYARRGRATAGATIAASLTSKLADSALLGYLRRHRRAVTMQGLANLSFSAQK